MDKQSFILFDRVFEHKGDRRLYETWDFNTKQPTIRDVPKNWLSPVNYTEGILEFSIEVLEMAPVESEVSIAMGWWNDSKDPEIRHIADAGIRFSKSGKYSATVSPIKNIGAYYGLGEHRDEKCKVWYWDSAFADDHFYTFINPLKNPAGKEGFPYKIHGKVTISSC